MVPLKGIYYINDKVAKSINDEYLQAVIQGYKFTFMDHIYEKDNKYYKYKDGFYEFEEIKFDSIY